MNLSKLDDIVKRVTGKAKEDLEEAERQKKERDALRAKQRTRRKKEQRATDTAFEEVEEAACEMSSIFPRAGDNGKHEDEDDCEPTEAGDPVRHDADAT